MPFNQNLEKVLKVLGYSQTDFANKLGIHKSKMSRLVLGESEPDLELLQNLRHKFGVNLDWLICDIGKMKLNSIEDIMVGEPRPEYKTDENMLNKVISAQEKTIELQERRIEELESKLKQYENK